MTNNPINSIDLDELRKQGLRILASQPRIKSVDPRDQETRRPQEKRVDRKA